MRIATKDHPRWVWRLNFWLVDHQYDGRLDTEPSTISRLLNKIDPEWEWQSRLIERPGRWLICKMLGHRPVDDMCRNPEHRFCLACQRNTPNERVVR